MIRLIAFHLLLFVFPFIAYGLYVSVVRKVETEEDLSQGAPVYWLVISGLVLSLLGFLLTTTFTGSEPGGVYTPAQLRDGKLIPGKIIEPGGDGG